MAKWPKGIGVMWSMFDSTLMQTYFANTLCFYFNTFHLLRWNISLKLALHHDETTFLPFYKFLKYLLLKFGWITFILTLYHVMYIQRDLIQFDNKYIHFHHWIITAKYPLQKRRLNTKYYRFATIITTALKIVRDRTWVCETLLILQK